MDAVTTYSADAVTEDRLSRVAATWVGALFIAILIVPVVAFGLGGAPPFRADDWITVILFFYVFRHNRLLGRPIFSWPLFLGVVLWLGYAFAKTMGLLNSYELYSEYFVVNDLYTPLAFIKMAVMFFVVASLHIKPHHLRKLLWLMVLIALFESLIAYGQIRFPGRITDLFVQLYGTLGTVKMAGGTGEIRRAIGTIGNPNHLGAVLAVLTLACLTITLFGRRPVRRLLALGAAMMSAHVCVIVAESRTTLGSITLGTAILLLVSMGLPGRRGLPLALGLAAVIIMPLAITAIDVDVLPGRLATLVENIKFRGPIEGVMESIESRRLNWQYQIESVADTGNYWFGNGRAEVEMVAFDNGFVAAYVTSGYVGLLMHVGVYLFILLAALVGFFRCRHGPYRIILLAVTGFWGAMIVYESTAGYVGPNRVGSLLVLIMALVAGTMRSAFEDQTQARAALDDEVAPQHDAPPI